MIKGPGVVIVGGGLAAQRAVVAAAETCPAVAIPVIDDETGEAVFP